VGGAGEAIDPLLSPLSAGHRGEGGEEERRLKSR